jgi:hypothetical protein
VHEVPDQFRLTALEVEQELAAVVDQLNHAAVRAEVLAVRLQVIRQTPDALRPLCT